MGNFNYEVRDINLAKSGLEKIEWAYRNMPVLRAIEAELIEKQPFKGLKISVSVHVEAKTACLARALARGGAEVALTGCNPLSTQDDVAAGLASLDIMNVYAVHGDDEEHYWNRLRSALAFKPDIVIDDGGDFALLLHSELQDLAANLKGGCEETTTGVHRLEILKGENKLLYPVVAVNDARCKHLFDNRFGTGQSVWTAIMATTNLVVAGKTVVVAGYGMCGRGVAMRAKGLGAKVIITEINPVKAIEAIMDGFEVMPMKEAAKIGDYFRKELEGDKAIKEYRGTGLMIGLELKDEYVGLRNKLLFERHFFTGAAGAQVIRLLPSLTVSQETAASFVKAWRELTL